MARTAAVNRPQHSRPGGHHDQHPRPHDPGEREAEGCERKAARYCWQGGSANSGAGAAKGDVKFFQRRQNRTLRYLPCLAPGTDARKQAEAVAKRRESGETVGAIAGDLQASVATVRRMITGLLLAQQVVAGDYDKAWKPGDKQLVITDTKAKAA